MIRPVPVAVFASGSGTNLQSLLDHETPDGLYHVVVVVSDREGAGALGRAEAAGRLTRVIEVGGRPPEEVASEILALLDSLDVRAIFLAGYLRLVPSAVVSAYRRRILNIHPALLPAFGGKGMFGERVHEAVLASDAEESGATVHYVDEEYDTGAIVGPPMSTLPMASSTRTSPRATVFRKGYRFTATRSIGPYPCSERAAISSDWARRARRPA